MSKSDGSVATQTENPEIKAAEGELDEAQLEAVAGGSFKTIVGKIYAAIGGGGGSDSGGSGGGGGIRG